MHHKVTITGPNLASELLEQVPEFLPYFTSHLEQNEGEVLIHPLLYEVLGVAIQIGQELQRGSLMSASKHEDFLARVASLVERCSWSPDVQVINAIRVSFLEELIEPEKGAEPLVARYGERSRTLLRGQENCLEELAKNYRQMHQS